ncbi:MAG TPA: amidohydrolase family protein [Sporolactobacillaceae bacterium]|nr:amidohydrolase family protein [Sporolactobacillaceae bacterium]
MRIDAHQHYWKLGRGDYDWLTPDISVIYRNFLPEDLEPHLGNRNINGTILVQAAPTLAETDFILSISEKTDTVFGVVGWLDLTDPNFKREFERLRHYSKFVGIRLMIQDMADLSRVLESDYIQALSYFSELDFPVDLLVTSDQLPVLVNLLERVPDLRGVVDHLAKPKIESGVMEPWKRYLSEIAAHPNIYCKLSGMVTEADHRNWKVSDFIPYVQHIINEFGTERIMYGSDWPVCLQAAPYEGVYDLLCECLPTNMTAHEKSNLFGLNAKRFYRF